MEKPTGVIQKIIESLQQINALDTYSPIEKDIILHNLRAAYMIFLNVTPRGESEECRVESLELGVESEELIVKSEELRVKSEELRVKSDEDEFDAEFEEEVIIADEVIADVVIVDEVIVNEVIADEVIADEVIADEVIVDEVIVDEMIVDEVIADEMIADEMIDDEVIADEVIADEVIEVESEECRVESEEEIIDAVDHPLPVESPQTSYPIPHTPHPTPFQDDLLEFIPDAQPQNSLFFDEFSPQKPEKKSLNDLLTEKKEDLSIGSKFQQSFIPDLTKAIAINEKFTFIRELFRNSGVDFSNSIQKLNECENIESAFSELEVMKQQYVWDTTSNAYLSLCDLVRRRFMLQ